MDKQCKDCRHHMPYSGLCNSRQSRDWASSADAQRTDGWLSSLLRGTCGKRGRFFEIKAVRLVP